MTTGAVRGAVFVTLAMAISFVLSLAGSSLKSTVQVLFLPIADGFEVNRGTLAIATSLFAVVTGVVSPLIGHLADRLGAVPVLMIGTVTTGAVLILCASATEIWLFIVGYGVLAAIGFTMLANVPLGVLTTQLFKGRNTGLFYAVLINGSAVGFIVLVPLWSYLNLSLSWNEIFLYLGLAFLVVILPLSLVLLRFSARVERSEPEERATLMAGVRATARNARARPVIIAFCACGVTMAFVDVHLFPHMHDHGVSPAIGSVSVAVLGVLEIIGGLLTGRLCDLGRIRGTLVGAYLLRAGSMVLLPFFSSDAIVIVFGAVFGASYLATIVATTVWITRVVPRGSVGTAIGLLWTLHMIVFALSSQFGAMLADIQHNYLTTILVSAVIAFGAAALIALQPNPDDVDPVPADTRMAASKTA